jgi:hypothetical protein
MIINYAFRFICRRGCTQWKRDSFSGTLTRMLFLNVPIEQKTIAGTVIAIYILHLKSVMFIR